MKKAKGEEGGGEPSSGDSSAVRCYRRSRTSCPIVLDPTWPDSHFSPESDKTRPRAQPRRSRRAARDECCEYSRQWAQDLHQWAPDARKSAKHRREYAADLREWALDSLQWALDSREWALDSREWAPDSREWAPDSREWALDSRE
jgi:hypothetical protein